MEKKKVKNSKIKIGDVTVNLIYSDNKKIEECLLNILNSKLQS